MLTRSMILKRVNGAQGIIGLLNFSENIVDQRII